MYPPITINTNTESRKILDLKEKSNPVGIKTKGV